MTLTLTHSGVDVSAQLVDHSMTLKFNTLDYALLDPGGSLGFGAVTLTDDVADISWTGTCVAMEARTAVDKISGHSFLVCSAVNTTVALSKTALFDLSDVPTDTTTVLDTEASGQFELESGLGHLLTEGTYSKSDWNNLSFRQQNNANATSAQYGQVTVFRHGLLTGDQIQVTTADINNQYLPVQVFTVNQVTVTWPAKVATYLVEFGNGHTVTYKQFIPPSG